MLLFAEFLKMTDSIGCSDEFALVSTTEQQSRLSYDLRHGGDSRVSVAVIT